MSREESQRKTTSTARKGLGRREEGTKYKRTAGKGRGYRGGGDAYSSLKGLGQRAGRKLCLCGGEELHQEREKSRGKGFVGGELGILEERGEHD